MTIRSVHVYRYQMPLARPLELKGRRYTTRSGLLVRFGGDAGAVGWGEASPLPGFSRETLDQAEDNAAQLPRALEGLPVPGNLAPVTGCIGQWLGEFVTVPSVRFAVDSAVLNLLASARCVPLSALLARQPLGRVSVNGLLAGPADEVCAQAQKLRAAGYRAAKLKVGRASILEDVERVRGVRQALGDGIALRLDANRAWDYDTATRFAEGVVGCDVEYVEEPLVDPSHLVDFAGRTGLPVALDETVVENGARHLEWWRGVKAVVLKPTLLGGLEQTFWLARRAFNLGTTPVLSSSFETGLGLVTLANVAAALYDEDVPVGLDTANWLGEDVLDGPIDVHDGYLDLAELNALRVRPGCLKEIAYV